MWLLCDKDPERAARTAEYLKRQGVATQTVTVEEEFPTINTGISLAIFMEGWSDATVERVKAAYKVHALLCLPQSVHGERYTALLGHGYSDVVIFPPSPDYLLHWERKEPEQRLNLEDWLSKRRPKDSPPIVIGKSKPVPRRATVIAVIGAKGGVGKSTLATLLATELKQKGRVILADLDPGPGGNLASLHKLERTVTVDRFESLQSQLTEPELEQNMLKTSGGYWLIPRGERPYGLSRAGTERLIHLTGQYADYVVLDCHPGITVSTIEAIKEADRVFCVTTVDRTGWEGIAELTHKTDKPVQIVLNRVSASESIVKQVKDLLSREVGIPIVGIIREDTDLYNRVQSGLSIIGGKKTIEAVRQVIGAEETQKLQKRGWFNR